MRVEFKLLYKYNYQIWDNLARQDNIVFLLIFFVPIIDLKHP